MESLLLVCEVHGGFYYSADALCTAHRRAPPIDGRVMQFSTFSHLHCLLVSN